MRLTRTFVLRLSTDLAVRERICGDLQALPGRRTHPFKDDAELLVLLRRLAHEGTDAGTVSTPNQPSDPEPPGPGPIVTGAPHPQQPASSRDPE
jgi:hypothetical protein